MWFSFLYSSEFITAAVDEKQQQRTKESKDSEDSKGKDKVRSKLMTEFFAFLSLSSVDE